MNRPGQGPPQGGQANQQQGQPYTNQPPHRMEHLHNNQRSDNSYPPQQQQQRSPVTKQLKERTFSVDKVDFVGELYQGTFRVLRPNAMTQAIISSMRSQICGGYYHDPQNPGCGVPDFVYEQAEVFAFLHHCVVESPTWWDMNVPGGEVDDYAIVKAIYLKAIEVDPFRRGSSEKKSDRQGSGSSGDPQRDQSRADDTLAALVSEDFQEDNLE